MLLILPGNGLTAVYSAHSRLAGTYCDRPRIHDWTEVQCLTIPGNCRKAMKATSKLLLVDLVLREGNAPGFGSTDMVMMVMTGGEERTAREYGALLTRAGLNMARVISTASYASIVEAEPA